jgi:tRNA A37 threonylcarbamoyladenosine synthetase subunit TsaC/SUA5/YrdC
MRREPSTPSLPERFSDEERMVTQDVNGDAQRMLDTIAKGGIVIFPADVGYAIVGNHEAAIARIFAAKRRSFEKQCGMFTSRAMFDALAIASDRDRRLVETITQGHGLPLSVVTPYRADHHFFAGLTPLTRERSSRGGTIDMLMQAGALHEAVASRGWVAGLPVLGSSANQSLSGSKYRLEDVESPVRAAADLIIDYGATKYSHPDGMGSTIIELGILKPIRRGIVFDQICDITRETTGVDPRKVV